MFVPVVCKFYKGFFGRCPLFGLQYTQRVGDWPFLWVKEIIWKHRFL